MGFEDKKGGGDSSAASDAQMRMAQQLFSQTDPVRSALINRSASFLGVSPTVSAGPAAPSDPKAGLTQLLSGQQPGTGTPIVVNGPAFGDVTATPTFNAFRDTANRTFQQGKDNAIARLPAGGALTEALVGLEGDRASTLTQGAGAIYDQELNRAMSLGAGITGQSLSGLGQAAATQAAMAQANAQQNAGKFGALGSGLGAYLGFKA